MFIQTEETPNPATLKFLPGRTVMGSGVADFTTPAAAAGSPLAAALFAIDGVTSVFFGAEFVTVTKSAEKSWQALKPMILGAIMDHFTSGAPLLADGAATADNGSDEVNEGIGAEVVAQIKELIETRVRPAVAQDGGDIIYKGFKNGTVYLNMRGSCAGCPSSTATLKMGIENMLRHYIPEVLQVEAVA
ncbi:MAG: NifU family protein [Rhodospirillaceae bacterium]|nr:NifU family protein [Rhodospirillaceae bacterium]